MSAGVSMRVLDLPVCWTNTGKENWMNPQLAHSRVCSHGHCSLDEETPLGKTSAGGLGFIRAPCHGPYCQSNAYPDKGWFSVNYEGPC